MFISKSIIRLLSIIVAASLFWSGSAVADYALNLTKGVTPISKDIYNLHMLILWIVTIIAVGVFSVLIWSIYYHRKSRGAVAAQFHHNTLAEVIWTIIPIFILVAMAIPATMTLIRMEDTTDTDITIKVTGYQWKWKYDYMDEGFGFFSKLAAQSEEARQLGANLPLPENYLLEVDNPMVVPVNTKVRILTTAADVIHAWWVPALGWKRDAIPGFINDNWTYIEEPGIYRGQCAELCGRDHAFMPIVVHAVSQAEYVAWVDEMQSKQAAVAAAADKIFTKDELMERGAAVYNTHCVSCHQAEGQGVPGVFPTLVGSAITTGPVSDHINIVLYGKNLMPAFAEQLSDEEIATAITLERNKWGNYEKVRAGGYTDIVQPVDIKQARR